MGALFPVTFSTFVTDCCVPWQDENQKPHPLFEAFDECKELSAEELVLTAWKGTVLGTPSDTQMAKNQVM